MLKHFQIFIVALFINFNYNYAIDNHLKTNDTSLITQQIEKTVYWSENKNIDSTIYYSNLAAKNALNLKDFTKKREFLLKINLLKRRAAINNPKNIETNKDYLRNCISFLRILSDYGDYDLGIKTTYQAKKIAEEIAYKTNDLELFEIQNSIYFYLINYNITSRNINAAIKNSYEFISIIDTHIKKYKFNTERILGKMIVSQFLSTQLRAIGDTLNSKNFDSIHVALFNNNKTKFRSLPYYEKILIDYHSNGNRYKIINDLCFDIYNNEKKLESWIESDKNGEVKMGYLYFRIAQSCYFTGENNLAIKFGEIAKDYYTLNKDTRYLLETSQILEIAYSSKNNYPKAYKHLKYYDSLNTILANEKQYGTEQIYNFEYRKQKQAEVDSLINLKKEIENKNTLDQEKQKLATQKKISKTFFTITFLVAILILIISYLYIKSRKKNNIISNQNAQVKKANSEIIDSINYAKKIQSAILPTTNFIKSILTNSFIYYQPKDIVAGDFYWLKKMEQSILFAVADCTGHGVPGALMSVLCNNALNRASAETKAINTGKILDITRDIVISELNSEENVKDGMDIALCCINKKTLFYSGANNPLWIIRKETDTVQEFKADKLPIGRHDISFPYKTHEIPINKGDSIYIFSDGFADQFGGDRGKKYKTKQFKDFLVSIYKKEITIQQQLIQEEFNRWKGENEQIDDVCVMGIIV